MSAESPLAALLPLVYLLFGAALIAGGTMLGTLRSAVRRKLRGSVDVHGPR